VQKSGNGWREENSSKEVLRNIRYAFLTEDFSETWNAWVELCEEKKQNFLSDEDHKSVIRIIVKSQSNGNELSSLAFDLLKSHRWSSLVECLKALTEAGQYEVVSSVSTQVLTSLQQDAQSLSRSVLPRTLLSHVVIMAAVAHAHQPEPSVVPLVQLVRPLAPFKINRAGSKERSVKTFQGNGSPLSLASAAQFMKASCPHIPLIHQSLDFCRHVILAWGLDCKSLTQQEDGNRLARRFGLLFVVNDVDSIDMLLSTAQEACSEKYNRWLTLTVDHDTTSDWNDMTWFALLSSSIAQRKVDLAGKVWSLYNSFKPSNEQPSNRIWNALLDGYSRSGDWESMNKTWEQMKTSKTKPDVYNYTTMMTALFRSKLPNEAMLLLEEIKAKTAKGEIQLTSESITSVLHGLLYNGRFEEATQMYSQMCSGKGGLPKPKISTINTFLRAHGRQRDIDKIVATLKNIAELELEPDVFTYSTVLDAFSKVGLQDGVDQVYEMMKTFNVKESGVTLTTLIRTTLEREGEEDGLPDFNLALSVLDKMESRGPFPTAVTYTTIISALFHHWEHFIHLHKTGSLPESYLRTIASKDKSDSSLLLAKHRPEAGLALRLLEKMRGKNLQINRTTYHTMIAGLLNDRNRIYERDQGVRKTRQICLEKAMKLVEEVCKDPGANDVTWKLVLERLLAHCNAQDHVLTDQACKHLSEVLLKIEASDTPVTRTMQELLASATATINKVQ